MPNFENWEMGIAEDDCDGEGKNFHAWMTKNYPKIKIEFFANQSGGSYVLDSNGEIPENYNSNYFWDEFCSR